MCQNTHLEISRFLVKQPPIVNVRLTAKCCVSQHDCAVAQRSTNRKYIYCLCQSTPSSSFCRPHIDLTRCKRRQFLVTRVPEESLVTSEQVDNVEEQTVALPSLAPCMWGVDLNYWLREGRKKYLIFLRNKTQHLLGQNSRSVKVVSEGHLELSQQTRI